ncbi:putative signaling protein [bioreactor metagenome]|uniref:Putative signaling protein n=1 Tax=bioreactor metagenome TaxID=1076179 RepID=A0A645DZC5_9ZZZZ
MLKDLCQGMENGEFEIYFQPIIDVKAGCVDKIEALVRWNHPQKGFLNPSSFIKIAEESREIIPLGEYVFGEIMESMDLLKGTKYEKIPVSFNVSPIQLELKGYADDLIRIIHENQIDSSDLYIEITEAAILSQATEVQENLQKLRKAGFRIAIDDFGIQYSSLSYLERLDYDVLKIDSHFVQNIHKGKTSVMIFMFIKKLADEFGKECIVEGVETEEQLEQILKIGFHRIQGFYYAKPMSVRELLQYKLPEAGWKEARRD